MGQPKKPGPVVGLSRPIDKPIAKCGICDRENSAVVDGPGLVWANQKCLSSPVDGL